MIDYEEILDDLDNQLTLKEAELERVDNECKQIKAEHAMICSLRERNRMLVNAKSSEFSRHGKAPARRTVPLPGESGRDYLLTVLNAATRGLKPREIAAEMIKLGWTSTSATINAHVSTILNGLKVDGIAVNDVAAGGWRTIKQERGVLDRRSAQETFDGSSAQEESCVTH